MVGDVTPPISPNIFLSVLRFTIMTVVRSGGLFPPRGAAPVTGICEKLSMPPHFVFFA